MNEISKAAHDEPQQSVAVRQESAPAIPLQQVLDTIARLSTDDRVDAQKVTALFDLQERLMKLQAKQQFTEALHRAQARMPRIPKNGRVDLGNGKGGYDFTKWEDIDRFIRPILFDEGLSFPTFSEETSDQNGIRWSATWRGFGHEEKNYITLPPDTGAGRNALQARGSTNSYAKRYLSEDFLALVREGKDDDGVRGAMKFITDEQCDELRDLLKEVGRQEGPFLDAMFGGKVRSVDELEAESPGYLAARNTLLGIQAQRQKKGSN